MSQTHLWIDLNTYGWLCSPAVHPYISGALELWAVYHRAITIHTHIHAYSQCNMHAFALWEEAGALWELGLSSMIPGTLLFILQVKVLICQLFQSSRWSDCGGKCLVIDIQVTDMLLTEFKTLKPWNGIFILMHICPTVNLVFCVWGLTHW